MSEHTFDEAAWRRLQETLDARGDPLRDPRLAARLRSDAEGAAGALRLLARLELLRTAEPARASAPGRSRWRAAAALAAALVLAALAGWAPRMQAGGDAPRRIDTAAITLEHSLARSSPADARGERVVLEPRSVLTWTLQGDEPCCPR